MKVRRWTARKETCQMPWRKLWSDLGLRSLSEQSNNLPCAKTSLCRSHPGLGLWMTSKGDDGVRENGKSWRTSGSSGCLGAVVDDDQWSHSLLDLSPFFSSVGSELGRFMRDERVFIRWSSSSGARVRDGFGRVRRRQRWRWK